MNHTNPLSIAIALLVVSASGLCQSTKSPCWKAATTQSEINRCADLDARKADSVLNHTYKQLVSNLKSDRNARAKLRTAERAWLAFRDAQLQALFPAEDKQAEYGTMFPMCYAQAATAMTRARTAQLRKMLHDNGPC